MSWRPHNHCSHHLHIFRYFLQNCVVHMLLSVLTVSSNSLNPHLNIVCIRNSVFAWNNDPSLKALCVTIRDLLFSKYARIANPWCSPVQTIMAWLFIQLLPHSSSSTHSKLLSLFCSTLYLLKQNERTLFFMDSGA